ncbi:polynucleotide phosphorylase [Lapidilactobacillus concavus DSM 17758]|uniref:Polyribonucleotide nucleotidyltransferase n=1 Tax=Lapidilactobacillus concavus DSM 17758 TaxID=1423735 RepID=A0A0R1W4C2_9LACO|nr:polyribonucleotide nucleotidyltransferase [Lapidilactobacillus concavus]KRM10243.1 polynucleotide phosphorylase [Lapidilactobacillus concavus DSM 17758]GEL13327.1 polyribonucleotide nucleotidyltransferase [Lapidilactobacillus concavus]
MTHNKRVFQLDWAGKQLQVEVGQVAQQANGAVLVRFGDSVVLSAVVAKPAGDHQDFFPLTINYDEKMFAAGKIPGGFNKREGKPSTHATLTARLIDRPIRPLFPEGFVDDVQITNIVFSADTTASPELMAMLGSSLALGISEIPFEGPIAGVKVARVDGELQVNTHSEALATSDLDVTVAGTASALNMVEAGGQEIPEDEMLAALQFGHQKVQELCQFEQEVIAAVGKTKLTFEAEHAPETLVQEIEANYRGTMRQAMLTPDKLTREENISAVKNLAHEHYASLSGGETDVETLHEVDTLMAELERQVLRRLITVDKIRPDGRQLDEIRSLDAEVGLLPRTHGSGLFTRGQTQVLSALTLAPISEAQEIDGLTSEYRKTFVHHYNFPQFSVGETGRYGAPGRRELGHGALGERALQPVIPDTEQFPYAIRLVSTVLESNGSSSQASICASTLALLDGGVPIKAPVAGIAMGLVKDGNDFTILTDIQGIEDHLGDMDFKVAGTRQGITALQMDIKADGVTQDILAQALAQAKSARLQILDKIEATIAHPRPTLSPYAPKIVLFSIDPAKIKDVIGRGGETINEIIDQTGVKINIEQTGEVTISSHDEEAIDQAKQMIGDLTREIKVGEVYMGTVDRIEPFGAFVELAKGKSALVHISQLTAGHIDKVEEAVKIGDQLLVKVVSIDGRGRINASRKALLTED